MMRHDEPGPDLSRHVDCLGRGHISRHAARRIAAIDRQQQRVERFAAKLVDEPRVSDAISAMIEPATFRLDHVPQVKMTPVSIKIELLVSRGNRAHPKTRPFDALARVDPN